MTGDSSNTPIESARGSCLCGAVAFRIEGAVKLFQYCHCSRCRKSSGSAHAANIFVPADQLVFEQGQELLRRYELPTAKYWCSAFCATCGARLPWLTRNGKAYVVPAGSLDDDPGARPTRNVHFASRGPWYLAASDLETHDGEPVAR